MDDNINQLSRWWIAKAVISESIETESFSQLFYQPAISPTISWVRDSHPYDLAPLVDGNRQTQYKEGLWVPNIIQILHLNRQ